MDFGGHIPPPVNIHMQAQYAGAPPGSDVLYALDVFRINEHRGVMKLSAKVAAILTVLLAATQTACIAVGYSGRGGWFIWPGGLGLLLLIGLIFVLMRRR